MYNTASLSRTLSHSATAQTLASRAFFSPGMLALLYFPAEHKYAVYTPLFASALVPLVATAVKEIKAWRKQRRGEVE
jgi:phosphatidylinositol glycan class S